MSGISQQKPVSICSRSSLPSDAYAFIDGIICRRYWFVPFCQKYKKLSEENERLKEERSHLKDEMRDSKSKNTKVSVMWNWLSQHDCDVSLNSTARLSHNWTHRQRESSTNWTPLPRHVYLFVIDITSVRMWCGAQYSSRSRCLQAHRMRGDEEARRRAALEVTGKQGYDLG